MPRFSAPLHLILAALVAVSALGAGHARGQAHVAGEIVICAGHGVVTITVDAEGRPVERQVLCPDCAPTFLADTAAPEPLPRPAGAAPPPRPLARHPVSARSGTVLPGARAPPRRA